MTRSTMPSSVSRSCVTTTTVRPRSSHRTRSRPVERARGDRVEARGRLVEKQHLGLERERARDRRALAHAAGELARHLGAGVGRQAGHARCAGAPAGRGAAAEASACSLSGVATLSATVSEENSAPSWNIMPKRVRSARELLGRGRPDVGPEEPHGARRRAQQADDLPQQHRLAGAAAADDRDASGRARR